MDIFNNNQSVGDIVAQLPKASSVFKKHKIDFCCGGKKSLSQAVMEAGADENIVVKELQKAYEESVTIKSDIDFTQMSLSELINHIESTHHFYVKNTLPEISEYANMIMSAHGINHHELYEVHKLFNNLRTELEQHLVKEEKILFPLIKEYEAEPSDTILNEIKTVMKETQNEHETAGEVLRQLRKITQDYMIPGDVCATFCVTYQKLTELEEDLFEHIHLENNILFKSFE